MKTNLQKKMKHIDPFCPCYGEEEEIVEHGFLNCREVKSIWFASQVGGIVQDHFVPFNRWLGQCLETGEGEFMQQIFGLLWSILKMRSLWVF